MRRGRIADETAAQRLRVRQGVRMRSSRPRGASPRFRRTATVALAALAALLVPALSPAGAAEAPRLAGAVITTAPGETPGRVVISTTLALAGDVSGFDATWVSADPGDGHVQRVVLDGMSVNAGLSSFTLQMTQSEFMIAGTWSLESVRLNGPATGNGTYDYGAGAPRPIPGPAPTFSIVDGPASLSALGDLAGSITSVALTAPAGDPRLVASGGAVTTALGFSTATSLQRSVKPVYKQVDGPVMRGLASTQVGTAAGSTNVTVNVGSSFWVDGAWRLERVIVTAGPVGRIYYPGGLVRTWVSSTLPALSSSTSNCVGSLGNAPFAPDCTEIASGEHTFDLGTSATDFTVTGVGTREYVAPSLTGLSLSKTSVAPGGTVVATATYTDSASLPKSPNAQLLFGYALGRTYLDSGSSTATCGSGPPYTCQVTATITVPLDQKPGVYRGSYARTTDSAGNTIVYLDDGTYESQTWTTEGGALTAGMPHVAGVTLTVTDPGGAPDLTPPVLTAFSRIGPVSVDATDDSTLGADAQMWSWSGTDGAGSGIARVEVVVVTPSSQGIETYGWNPQAPATTGSAGVIPVNAYGLDPGGEQIVRYVTVVDKAGNSRRYDADGAVVPGTSKHTLDFATAGFLATIGPVTPGLASAPRSLTVQGRDEVLVVSWAPPLADGGSPVTSYDVTLEPGGISLSGVEGTSVPIGAGLQNGTAYAVSVRANTAAGAGAVAWKPGTAVGPVVPVTAPVVGAVASPRTTSSVAFTASAAASAPGVVVTGYQTQVRRAMLGAKLPTSWSTYGGVRVAPGGSVSGIKVGERVCLRVASVNAVGTGAASTSRCTVRLADDRSLLRATAGWASATSSSAYAGTLTRGSVVGARLVTPAAHGTGIWLRARAQPGGGTVGVYLGTTKVATWSLASSTTAYVTKLLPRTLTGQKVVFRIEKVGTAGVSVDGWGIRT